MKKTILAFAVLSIIGINGTWAYMGIAIHDDELLPTPTPGPKVHRPHFHRHPRMLPTMVGMAPPTATPTINPFATPTGTPNP